MKPTGTFDSLFAPHKRSKKPTEVMSGNLKHRPASRTITMQFSEEQIEIIERECEEQEIQRNKYLSIVLDHYLCCRKK